MTTRSQSEADSIAAAGFSDVYQPVKSYLDDLDIFLQSQVQELEPEVQEHVRYVFGHSGKRLRPMLVAYSGWQGPAENCAAVHITHHCDEAELAAKIHLVDA